MRLVALYDFHWLTGKKAEVLQFGDEFTPPGTGVGNVAEHARSLIAQGAAMPLEDWKQLPAKKRAQLEANHAWARAQEGGRA